MNFINLQQMLCDKRLFFKVFYWFSKKDWMPPQDSESMDPTQDNALPDILTNASVTTASTAATASRQCCQMAIAGFLDHLCLALRASGLWLRCAALQNLIPSFPWIAPHALHPGAIQGKEGIKFCHLVTFLLGPRLDVWRPHEALRDPLVQHLCGDCFRQGSNWLGLGNIVRYTLNKRIVPQLDLRRWLPRNYSLFFHLSILAFFGCQKPLGSYLTLNLNLKT